MTAKIRAEWDPLRKVVIHRPGIEMFFGLLEPYASLYERAFSRFGARREHERLEYILRYEFGVEVLHLKQAILDQADRNSRVRDRLVERAEQSICFGGDTEGAALARKDLERNIPLLDSGHFFNILLLAPGIEIRAGEGTRAIHLNITEREPLSNLYFMRDQQAVTDRGIVLGSMSKPQRRREPELTGLLWEILGLPVVHEVQAPGTFEGGDFIPMGEFALLGTGDRTNEEGVSQVLAHGVGFDEVGVVSRPRHPLISGDRDDPMIDMHLDTYFNVASPGVAVGSETLLRQAEVRVYYREGEGRYTNDPGRTTTLHDYIREKGFEIIDITTLEQMAYASNFLCIREGQILAVEVDRTVPDVIGNLKAKAGRDPGRYGKLLSQVEQDYRYLRNEGQFFPHKKEIYQHDIDAYPFTLENLTGGYGGAHCMTCALKRG
ncbi:arginine deiminase [Methanolinea mesophila]|uniref:arginine deiminase family protein n=1 Tax=Methanolinea mesophila TaxID=547055 RepID=UPI001AE8BB9B|nr:arginine deiminase family protein [Methanolinea mesophila]MBP1929797.1 arginine deiminase [Methanolinea mesophila]